MSKLEAERETLVNDLETSRFQYDLLLKNTDEETASLKRQVKCALSSLPFAAHARCRCRC